MPVGRINSVRVREHILDEGIVERPELVAPSLDEGIERGLQVVCVFLFNKRSKFRKSDLPRCGMAICLTSAKLM